MTIVRSSFKTADLNVCVCTEQSALCCLVSDCARTLCELKIQKLTKHRTVNTRITNPLENNNLLKLTEFQAQKKVHNAPF